MFRALTARLLGPRKPLCRRPARVRPRLEPLEDRLVPTNWDYTNLVQTLGGYPSTPLGGPNHLSLNFDGAGNNISPFAGSTADIQEVLYRTSEIYAPFNVAVSRIYGKSAIDYVYESSTLFVGADSNNVRNGAKFAYSYTPPDSTDYPGNAKSSDHRPNSDAWDMAFVDPVTGYDANGKAIDQSDVSISQSIAHESGHTFGLAHVRTDIAAGGAFRTDPAPLGGGTVNDVMSYTDANQFFANVTLPITNYNFDGAKTAINTDLQPRWWSHKFLGIIVASNPITTQNSFTYLQTVLGPRPADGEFHVSDAGAIDPGVAGTLMPGAPNLHDGTPINSSVNRVGDYNVYQLPAALVNQPLIVDLVPTGGKTLRPYLQVFAANGQRLASVDSTWNPATGAFEIHTTLQPVGGANFVVGARDATTTGTFRLSVGQKPVAHDDGPYAVAINTPLTVSAAAGPLANDFDPNGYALTAQLVAGPAHGSLDYFHPDGSFEYRPGLNFYGNDQFTYQAVDAYGVSNVATVRIRVNPVAPTALDLNYRVLFNGTLTTTPATGVLAYNSGPNGLTLHAVRGQGPAHGTLTLNDKGSFTYRPNAGFRGTDSFTYAVYDGLFNSPNATVTLTVGQPPVAQDLSYFTNPGQALHVSAAMGLVASNGAVGATAHLDWGPPGLVLSADGSFTYTPRGRFRGEVDFTYYLTSPDGTSNIATVSIMVGDPFGPPY
jgi:hypothetical protein